MPPTTRTPGRTRVLSWERCLNVRDLGGLPTRDGRRTRWGALVRADSLCRLTDAGLAAVRAHGISTILDLRGAAEVASQPGPFGAGAADVTVLHFPIESHVNTVEGAPAGYALTLDANQALVAAAATAIARAPDGGVLFHCHAGKDRTGIVAAVLLALAGVPDDLIVEDYLVLGDFEAIAREWVRWIVEHTDDPAERARLLRGAPPDPDVMRALLRHLQDRHGGAERYLVTGGVDAEDLRRLRERVVESRDPVS
jgi:protein tyrosine/serine phosphatase